MAAPTSPTPVMSVRESDAQLTAAGQSYEIVVEDIGGRPVRTWKNAARNLVELLERSRGHGDKPFVVYEDEVLTFADHHRRVATLAHQLIEDFGVRPGDRVAIAMRNFPEWPVAFWASVAAGAVV